MDKLTHLSFALLLAAASPAQDLPLSPALERAIAADELEHDVPRAKELLRAVAEDAAQSDAVRRHAWLRLARLLWRTGEEAGDALAKAAVGEDAVAAAAREMLAQGKGDPEREAELLKRAAEAVEAALGSWNEEGLRANALWFGAAAVPHAIRAFESSPSRSSMSIDGVNVHVSAALLWSLQGDSAGRFIREVLQSDDVERRHKVVSGLPLVATLPLERLDQLRVALRDADAAVVVRALRFGSMTSCQELLYLALDPRDQVRGAAMAALVSWAVSRFRVASATEDVRADSEAIAAVLPRLLAATSLDDHRAAVQVAALSSMFSRAGRASLAASLLAIDCPTMGGLTFPQTGIDDWEGTTENAGVLRDVFVRLAPVSGGRARETLARDLASAYLRSCWDRAALDTALTALRHRFSDDVNWVSRHATDADVGAVVAGLAGSDALRRVAPWLAQRDLPAAAFASLRDALSSAPNWQDDRALVLALGRTGHPDAAALLRSLPHPKADYANVVLQALTWNASKRADAEAMGALRAQLAASLPITETSPRPSIAAAVGTLVRLGDTDVVGMFADLASAFSWVTNANGVAQGVRVHVDASILPGSSGWPERRTLGSPVAWLTHAQTNDGVVRWWHGYTAEQVRALWRRLLAPKDGEYGAAWDYAYAALQPLPDASGADPLLVQVVVEAARARIAAVEEMADAKELAVLFGALEGGTLPESVRAPVRDLREAAFTARAEKARVAAIQSLAAPFDAADRAHLLRGLADESPAVSGAATRPFEENAVPVDREVVAAAFRSPSAQSRQGAFNLLRRVRDDVPDILRGLVDDPDDAVRHEACRQLGESLRLDAVPALLAALKDSVGMVREAATQSLQAIRYYHDEKAHWDRVFDGRAGLTAQSAAAALLEQAKPGGDAATRVLAIRSLGVLAAPETQPFLIEWTKDADPDVAAAAREAVGRIHAKAR